MKTKLTALMAFAFMVATVGTITYARQQTAQEAAPSIERIEAPSSPAPSPSADAAAAAAAEPTKLVYVGPEGGFLLHPGRSHGIFRWSGQHWANSTAYYSQDANYYYYQLVGTNGWFSFGKNPTGGTYVIFKGLGPPASIVWQDLPNGWMRATRGPAVGNLN
jgi:hypothetical protein